MAKIIWSPSALEDIKAIHQFISRDSSDRASLFIDRIIELTNKLQNFPKMGRVIPEIGNENSREIIYGSYRIMYKLADPDIWITGIIHTAMDWNP